MMTCSSENKKILLQLIVFVNFVAGVFADPRIVNGADAVENEFPFVVSLQKNGTHFCGGTILDETHILTAAHCICKVNWDIFTLLSIKFTSLKLNDPNALSIPIQDVICNDYDVLELIRDIAVIQLSEKIPAAFYQPVKLAKNDFSTAVPLYGVSVGWGLTSTKGTISNVLQKVDVVVYNDDICAKSYFGTRNIEHQICSGWPLNGKGSCQGDSGGPLLVENVQIGVISFGDDTDCSISDLEAPKVSARVSAYLDWISDAIKADIISTEEQTTIENVSTQEEEPTTVISVEVITEDFTTENDNIEKSDTYMGQNLENKNVGLPDSSGCGGHENLWWTYFLCLFFVFNYNGFRLYH